MDKWVAEGVDTVRNWTLRAVELEKLGRYEEAVQGSDEAHNLQMLPDNFAEYYLSVGRSYLKMGNEEMARVTLLKSALHNPLVPDPWVLLGDIEFLANKHKRAAPYYMASLPALPNGQFWVKNVPYHTYEPLEKLGHCYAHMGDFTKGIGFLERAVACSPAKGPVKAHIKKTIQELRKMKK
jgi:tetratricopeptide (TPR) repeat protein